MYPVPSHPVPERDQDLRVDPETDESGPSRLLGPSGRRVRCPSPFYPVYYSWYEGGGGPPEVESPRDSNGVHSVPSCHVSTLMRTPAPRSSVRPVEDDVNVIMTAGTVRPDLTHPVGSQYVGEPRGTEALVSQSWFVLATVGSSTHPSLTLESVYESGRQAIHSSPSTGLLSVSGHSSSGTSTPVSTVGEVPPRTPAVTTSSSVAQRGEAPRGCHPVASETMSLWLHLSRNRRFECRSSGAWSLPGFAGRFVSGPVL